jgi:hypothetical protein
VGPLYDMIQGIGSVPANSDAAASASAMETAEYYSPIS